MAAFPSLASLPVRDPITVEEEFKNLSNSFDELGAEIRRQKWLYPRRNVIMRCENVDKADGVLLWQFYLARKGSFEAFNFFLPYSETYTQEYVGTGDGSTVLFNLPAKGSSAYTLYVNGNAQTGGGTDYTFGGGTGEDGADKVTFTVAPNDGYRIVFSFTGDLKIRCRFKEDVLQHKLSFDRLFGSDIELKGLLNDQ